MAQRKTRSPLPWSPKEEAYLEKRVKKDFVHPYDLVGEINRRFRRGRTQTSVEKKVQRMGISWEGLARKSAIKEAEMKAKQLSKPKQVKEAIKDDVEKAKLLQKYQEVSLKYKTLVIEQTLGERMIRVLKDEAKVLPRVKVVWRQPEEKVTKEEAVLLLGDLHLGEIVDKSEVYGFGEYNFTIFSKRMKFLLESIKSITVKKLRGYEVNKLHVFGLGDMISGLVHEELRENAEDIMFQILNGAYVTAQFILELKQMFSEVSIDGVLGNHGRLYQKKSYKKRYTNWDYVFYQFVSTFLAANEDIVCQFPKSFFLIKKIYDWNFLVLHGDSIRSWMRIPWYGIERAMWRLGDLLQGKGINVHYRVLAHFHNTGELDRVPGEIIINGSMIGGNEYSLINMFSFDRPTQLFFGVHEEIGVTWRYPLRLDLPEVDNMEPYRYNEELDAAKYMKEFLSQQKALQG